MELVPDLTGLYPFLVVLGLVALVGVAVSLAVIVQSASQVVAANHRTRVARHESIPTYYRRLIVSH